MAPSISVPLLALAKDRVVELLAPEGLWLGALLVPLVVLYILKVRRARRRVASTWLWSAAQRDLLAKSPFKRLWAQLPLIVQALALAMLALALARPATRGRAFNGDHLAIILDISASMSAWVGDSGEAPATRIERAKKAATELLASLTPGSDAMVLAAGRDARIVAPLDRDRERVRAAIERVQAQDVEGDLGQAVALAVERLRQLSGTRRIVVITDGNLAHPASLVGAALPLEVLTVGTPVDNAAIVRVDVRSSVDPSKGTQEIQGFLVVANYGASPRALTITLREENASDVLASRREVVQPGERKPMQLRFHPTPGDFKKGLIFDIAPQDAMPVDDAAYAQVPAGDKLPVFVAGASPWWERAIAADPLVELRTGSVAELSNPAIDLDTFVVVDGACPEHLPGGDVLIVHPPPGRCAGVGIGEEVSNPDITSWETGDPRMRFLTLDGVHVARANLLETAGASQRLMVAQQGTLASDIATNGRAGTLLGFDVGESDWPLKASFVVFVRNLLEQARAHRARGLMGPAHAGESMRVSLPRGTTHVEARGPSGEVCDVMPRGDLAVVPNLAKAGLYRVSWQGAQAGSTLVPVNLTSAAESDLTSRPLDTEPGKVIVTQAVPPEAHHEWTWVLALAALGLVVFDVWYLTRAPRTGALVVAWMGTRR